MRVLFHFPICAFSRTIRFMLKEKKLDFSLKYESPWSFSEEFSDTSVSKSLPVLKDINGLVVSGFSAIREYLDEVYPDIHLIGNDYEQRAESRRIADWASFDFYHDVYSAIVNERIMKRFSKDSPNKAPDPNSIRSATSNLNTYMDYISWLVDRRNWLAGQYFSIADIYTSSFLSVLDYLGCVPWNKHEITKEWYARIKSRPSFKSILMDNLPQIPPSKDYSNLDF